MATKEERLAALAGSDLTTLEQGAAARENYGDDTDEQPKHKTDPGIDLSEEQARRIEQVIDDHTRDAISQLTDLRDRADALMHTMREADAEVKDVMHNYARKVAKAVKAKVLIARALTEIEAEFAIGSGAKPNTVISQTRTPG